MPQFEVSLTDEAGVIIYDCNMFIIQATAWTNLCQQDKTWAKFSVIEVSTYLKCIRFAKKQKGATTLKIATFSIMTLKITTSI
jgi:hypothetical protein